jgi:PadR family transcriptional regulator PadR
MKNQGKSELPQGTLDPRILGIVAQGPNTPLLREPASFAQGPAGSAGIAVCGVAQLEYKKLLAADWAESESRRQSKFYRLTSAGRAHLNGETEGRARLTEAVALILESA